MNTIFDVKKLHNLEVLYLNSNQCNVYSFCEKTISRKVRRTNRFIIDWVFRFWKELKRKIE